MENSVEKKQPLKEMIRETMDKVREMADTNTIVGQPITTPDGVTLIPISKISIGFGGGGSDFNSKHPNQEQPFGGGMGAGVKVTPIAFLVIKGDSVRMLPVASAPSTTADRLVEMVPDVIDQISALVDQKKPKQEEVSE